MTKRALKKVLREAAVLIAEGNESYMCEAVATVAAERYPRTKDKIKYLFRRLLRAHGISPVGDLFYSDQLPDRLHTSFDEKLYIYIGGVYTYDNGLYVYDKRIIPSKRRNIRVLFLLLLAESL